MARGVEKPTIFKGPGFYVEVSIGGIASDPSLVIKHFKRDYSVARKIESSLLDFDTINRPLRVTSQYAHPGTEVLVNRKARKAKTATGGGGQVFVE